MKKYLILVLIVLLIGALTVGVLAGKKGFQPLDQIPVYYDMFQGVGDDPTDFPSVWSGYDGDGTYWDTSELKVTSNGQTVHDVLAFFYGPGNVKPYVLVNQGDNLYESKGEIINYEYEGEKKRAVVTTWLQLDEDGQYDWMVLRADYYRLIGPMEYFITNIYVVWDAEEFGSGMPAEASDALDELINAGPANVGGQRP